MNSSLKKISKHAAAHKMVNIYKKKFFQLKTLFIFVSIIIMLGFIVGYGFAYFVQQKSINARYHYSYLSTDKDFYDKSYVRALKMPKIHITEPSYGATVNHHLLASSIIAHLFDTIAASRANNLPDTVILISLNHFSRGKSKILASLYDWQTPYGVLESNKKLIKTLEESTDIDIEEPPFKSEHGIFNIVPFIKKSFPHARVVPIILKDNLSLQEADRLAQELFPFVNEDVLVIASVDFSHLLPPEAAEFHDSKSKAVLESLDLQGVEFLDVDSKPGIRALLKLMQMKGANSFVLTNQTNSAELLKDPNLTDTTSYVNGVFVQQAGPAITRNTVTILAFGDVMLDRDARYTFEPIERLLGGNDITLANFEKDIAFDSVIASTLKHLGFTPLEKANNKRVSLTGFTLNTATRVAIRGTSVGFVGYNELNNRGFESIISKIQALKNTENFVISYLHSDNEYTLLPSKEQQNTARALIDEGASLVLGSSSRLMQPIELYNNRLIFYSLPGLQFDQTFSKDGVQGLGVGIVVEPSKTMYYLFPMEIRSSQVYLLFSRERATILQRIARDSLVPEEMKEAIRNGKIEIETQNRKN